MTDKTFDPAKIEKKFIRKWKERNIGQCSPQSDKTPFTIMMPPPNVTGSLHMGHAFEDTIMDTLCRYKRMRGLDVLWQPGMDHAGIATQMVVERQLAENNQNRWDMGREKFLEKVWKWKEESGGQIFNQLERLGATPDWERSRFTMDEGLSRAVRKVFVQLYEEKLIYKDQRLVNWDPKLRTAISDLEVDQKEQKGNLWHISYPVEGEEALSITVATTRPETLLGDAAVAVHPEDPRYKDLIGKYVCLPIAERLIPVIADEHANPEHGSGAVKITPAHDFNDFEVGQRHNLTPINILDEQGFLNDNTPEAYRGLDRFEAREKILKELEEMECLEKSEEIKHAVPLSQRTGVIVEPYLTYQWFCDAKTLAQPAIKAVQSGDIKFVPENWVNTYNQWMENIQPWCISRQLWWGHQIPAWYDDQGNVYVAQDEHEAQKQAGEGVKLTRDEDVLDTWFSSALWPFSTLGWPDQTCELKKYYPTSVLTPGFDIIFFWVARMIMMGLHFTGDVPFKTVYFHALVRDSKGQKMSKSKGNVVDPLEIVDKYGADALRFTLTALSAQGRDIKLSESRIEGYRNFATKLWNAARYCQMKECYPQSDFDPSSLESEVNQWIVNEISKTLEKFEKAIESYRFNEAANTIYQFAWGTFCDWYLEFTKPALNQSQDTQLVNEIKGTTGWVLDKILIMLNPIMPFITEELYEAMGQHIDKRDLVAFEKWPELPDIKTFKPAVEDINWLIKIISEIRSLRADMNVPAGARIELQIKGAAETTLERIEKFSIIIEQMARLSSIQVIEGQVPKGAVQTVLNEANLILPIADIINVDEERQRLKKEIDKLNLSIKKLDQKLENKKFLQNAPEDVVEEQKQRKIEAQENVTKLSRALKQIEAA